MANGTAWRGHLPVTQDIRGDRYPYWSPKFSASREMVYSTKAFVTGFESLSKRQLKTYGTITGSNPVLHTNF